MEEKADAKNGSSSAYTMQDILNAAKSYNEETLENLIIHTDINLTDDNLSSTALHKAVQEGDLEAAVLLLLNGSDPNIGDKWGLTPCHYAVKEGYLEILQVLHTRKGELEATDKQAGTPLHFAAKYDRSDILLWLIQRRLNLNCKREDGNTPLHLAALYGNFTCVRMLLESKASSDVFNKDNKTAEDLANMKGHDNVVNLFKGINVATTANNKPRRASTLSLTGIRNKQTVSTDIIYKAAKLREEKFLAGHAKDIDMEDKTQFDRTALHKAVEYKDLGVVMTLLNYGANPNATDKWEATPVHHAAGFGCIEILKVLFANKGNLMAMDNTKSVPLHFAAKNGKPTTLKWLIEQNVEVNYQNSDGCTALHLAASNGKTACVKILLRNGGGVNIRNSVSKEIPDNKTATDLAVENQCTDTIEAMVHSIVWCANSASYEQDNENSPDDRSSCSSKVISSTESSVAKLPEKTSVKNLNSSKNISITTNEIYRIAHCRNEVVLKEMNKNNININVHDKRHFHRNALHKAVDYDDHHAVRLLLQFGVNANAKDKYQQTPMHYAASYGFLHLLKILYDNNNSLTARDDENRTLMHIAAKTGKVDVLEWLLKQDEIDIDNKDINGNTPLHLASRYQHEKCVHMLLEHNANIHEVNNDGKTAKDIALGNSFMTTVEKVFFHRSVTSTDISRTKSLRNDIIGSNSEASLEIIGNSNEEIMSGKAKFEDRLELTNTGYPTYEHEIEANIGGYVTLPSIPSVECHIPADCASTDLVVEIKIFYADPPYGADPYETEAFAQATPVVMFRPHHHEFQSTDMDCVTVTLPLPDSDKIRQQFNLTLDDTLPLTLWYSDCVEEKRPEWHLIDADYRVNRDAQGNESLSFPISRFSTFVGLYKYERSVLDHYELGPAFRYPSISDYYNCYVLMVDDCEDNFRTAFRIVVLRSNESLDHQFGFSNIVGFARDLRIKNGYYNIELTGKGFNADRDLGQETLIQTVVFNGSMILEDFACQLTEKLPDAGLIGRIIISDNSQHRSEIKWKVSILKTHRTVDDKAFRPLNSAVSPFFKCVMENIGNKWTELAKRLGLSKFDLNVTDHMENAVDDKVRLMLNQWLMKSGRKAIPFRLIMDLQECGCHDIANQLQQQIK
ncbi:Ankyrin-3 [Trichoplax sp. H2]|nr:Ankyrin-3 [Trichoplax sp. H2]|eukprot:RDD38549.1 Ankyrin-3 [Trichoplax sp. H2]